MRPPVLVLVALVLTSLLAGCSSSGAQEDAASTFLAAWARGDVAAAAAATDDPPAAAAALTSVDSALGLGPGELTTGSVGSEDGVDTVAYTASWPLAGVADPWRYSGRVAVAAGPDGTPRVRWQPQDVHPALGPGQALSLARSLPPRAPLLAVDGRPLVTPVQTVTVGLVPGQAGDLPATAGVLADALAIDAGEIVTDAQAARAGDFVPVITLRRTDYDAVRDRIYTLPGVLFRSGTDLLGPTPTFAQPLLGRVGTPSAEELRAAGPGITASDEIGTSGLQQALNAELTGRAGAAVRVLGAGGSPVAELATFPGAAPTPVRTTLDLRVQQAAETALADVDRTATIVAVRPSDGALLAVANSASAPFDVALAGRYPPGSTFKIVTAAAALGGGGSGAGGLRPDTPVDCPPTITLNGRVLPNEDAFGLGTVPLSTAFARSCNTTFAELGVRAGSDALGASAARFGIGAGWTLPVDSFSGSYTGASDPAALGGNAIGQGTDLVSPLADALLAATVARGSVPVPQLLAGRPAGVAAVPEAPDPAVLAALVPMMRAVVTDGTATELADVPGGPVAGKTGTAEHGTGSSSDDGSGAPGAHSWFTGYRGDLAFSVFVEDGQTGGVPADPVAARFLTGLAG